MSLATALTALDTRRDSLAANLTTMGVTASNTETLAQLVPKVLNIESGGGGTPTAVTPKDVNFYDYDGTLVAGYTIAEAQGLSTLPTAPDHSSDTTPLTFQAWNYTLAQVKATASKLDVGATYVTTDGKTHLHITLTAVSGLAPALYLNKSDASTLSIDWGDGNTSTFTNSGNFNTGAHTYSTAGDYIIKLWISNGTGTYGLGNSTGYNAFFGGGYIPPRRSLTEVYVGLNVTVINTYTFNGNHSLKSVTLSAGITSIGTYAFLECSSLRFVNIPSGVTSIGEYAFRGCGGIEHIPLPASITSFGKWLFFGGYSLKFINIPNGIVSIPEYSFYVCQSLTSTIIPASVTSIATYAFNSNYSNIEYILCSTTPPTLVKADAFTSINSICRIKVPSSSLLAYKTATNWSTYSNYMEGY